jgi:hypothetical protein
MAEDDFATFDHREHASRIRCGIHAFIYFE